MSQVYLVYITSREVFRSITGKKKSILWILMLNNQQKFGRKPGLKLLRQQVFFFKLNSEVKEAGNK